MKDFMEIPFGAKNSELKGWEYTIPEGYTAEIKDGKVIVKAKRLILNPFEQALNTVLKQVYYAQCSEKQSVDDFIVNVIKQHSKDLITLAKKELCKGCPENIEGYIKGKEDAEKDYMKGFVEGYNKAQEEHNKSVSFHHEPLPCFSYRGTCINPFHDCINCPKRNAGADLIVNTNSGTSDLVAHGNVASKYGNDNPYLVADGKLEDNKATNKEYYGG